MRGRGQFERRQQDSQGSETTKETNKPTDRQMARERQEQKKRVMCEHRNSGRERACYRTEADRKRSRKRLSSSSSLTHQIGRIDDDAVEGSLRMSGDEDCCGKAEIIMNKRAGTM